MVNMYGAGRGFQTRFLTSSTSTQWCRTRSSSSSSSGSVYGSGFRTKSFAPPPPPKCDCPSSSGGFLGVLGGIFGFMSGLFGGGLMPMGGFPMGGFPMGGMFGGGYMGANPEAIADSIVAKINSQKSGSAGNAGRADDSNSSNGSGRADGSNDSGRADGSNGSNGSGRADGSNDSGRADGSNDSGRVDGSNDSGRADGSNGSNGSGRADGSNGSNGSGRADGSNGSNGSGRADGSNGSNGSGRADGSERADGSGHESQGSSKSDHGASRGWSPAAANDVVNYQGRFTVHDDVRGTRGDVSRSTCTMSDETDPQSGFPLTIKVGPYSYKFERVQDGEAIYSSIGGAGDEYRLQKNTNGTFALNQYEGDKGAGTQDISSAKPKAKQKSATNTSNYTKLTDNNKYVNVDPSKIEVQVDYSTFLSPKRVVTGRYSAAPGKVVTVKIEVTREECNDNNLLLAKLKAAIEQTPIPKS